MRKRETPLPFLLGIIILLCQCEIKPNCRSPQLGETNNIKDAVFFNGKLVVLSSPQDVLTWCSSFITMYEYENESFVPIKVVELSGKIAKRLGYVDGKIAVALQDKEEIEIFSEDLAPIKRIPVQLSDIYYFAFSPSSFAVSSYIDSKILIVNNLQKFLESSGSDGSYVFQVDDIHKLKGFMLLDRFISFTKDKNSIMILPDRSEITFDIPVERYPSDITPEVVSRHSSFNFAQGSLAQKQNTDIVFLHPGYSSEDFIAAPSSISNEVGILIIFPTCLTKFISNFQTDVKFEKCAVFFRSSLLSEVRVSDFHFSLYKDYKKKLNMLIFFTSGSEKISEKNKAIFSLLVYDYQNNKFIISDDKELDISPFYLVYKAKITEVIFEDKNTKENEHPKFQSIVQSENGQRERPQKRSINIELFIVKPKSADELETLKFIGEYEIK